VRQRLIDPAAGHDIAAEEESADVADHRRREPLPSATVTGCIVERDASRAFAVALGVCRPMVHPLSGILHRRRDAD
jgi:hypothetical protein